MVVAVMVGVAIPPIPKLRQLGAGDDVSQLVAGAAQISRATGARPRKCVSMAASCRASGLAVRISSSSGVIVAFPAGSFERLERIDGL